MFDVFVISNSKRSERAFKARTRCSAYFWQTVRILGNRTSCCPSSCGAWRQHVTYTWTTLSLACIHACSTNNWL